MKYIIKGLFMALMMCVCLTSCRDDAELPDSGPVTNPGKETAGVYYGTLTRITTTATPNVEVVCDATLTLTPGSNNYVTEMNLKADDINLDLTANANIVNGGPGYMYQNPLTTNPFGNIFSGKITSKFEIDLFFKVTTREGRVTTTYEYSFVGQRQ